MTNDELREFDRLMMERMKNMSAEDFFAWAYFPSSHKDVCKTGASAETYRLAALATMMDSCTTLNKVEETVVYLKKLISKMENNHEPTKSHSVAV